jgi:outer membrane receptor protein involved in Fe transport
MQGHGALAAAAGGVRCQAESGQEESGDEVDRQAGERTVAGARYVGESYMDNVNLISNDAYTVADAALHYTYDDVTLALNVSNLFNREETTCTTAGGCQYISPQIVTSTVRYRW